MHVLGVDRVLIATPDVDGAVDTFEDLLGVSFGARIDPPDEPVTNRMSAAGIELVAPEGEDSPVGRFLAREGPGLYAVSVRVADLAAARDELAAKGVDPVAETDVEGYAELFYHPDSFEGALLVLCEYDATHPAEPAARAGVRGDE